MNSSREDYLLAIYRLSREEGFTFNVDIAKFLNLSKASVSEMIKKLYEDEIVRLKGTKISLTEKGRKKAQAVISCHRLWEYFLLEHLELEVEEAHRQADLLEHVTGEELFEKLNAYLGFPKKSPKGNVIYENRKE